MTKYKIVSGDGAEWRLGPQIGPRSGDAIVPVSKTYLRLLEARHSPMWVHNNYTQKAIRTMKPDKDGNIVLPLFFIVGDGT